MNFDIDWIPQDWLISGVYPKFPCDVSKPTCLVEMIKIAEILSHGFSYVRVDLYEISGRVYFGEMTFTPGGGIYPYKDTWTKERDAQLGSFLNLPRTKLVE